MTYPMGLTKELNLGDGEARLREFATPESTPERITQVDNLQTCFDFAQEQKLVLPPFMFLDVAEHLGTKRNTRSGALPHKLRVFNEAIIALELGKNHSKKRLPTNTFRPDRRENSLIFELTTSQTVL